MIQKHIYKPLPEGLTIRNSDIHGVGLFSTKEFPTGTFFGISHIHNSWIPSNEQGDVNVSFSFIENNILSYYPGNHLSLIEVTEVDPGDVDNKTYLNKEIIFPNSLIRTPLGGFINHSDDGNLDFFYLNSGLWGVSSNREIRAGEELTLNYALTPCGTIENEE